MYNLGQSTLLQLLQGYRQNGRLRAQLPDGIFGLQGGYVFLDVVQGSAVACHLVNMYGQLALSGNEAMSMIANMGVLDWVVIQEYMQTSPHLPAIRQNTSGLQAIRQQTSGLPAIRQNTSGHLPAITSQSYIGQGSSPHPATVFVPQRLIYIDTEILKRFPRHMRRVLVLVDGVRTVGKIVDILFPHEDRIREVLLILRELEDMSVLTIKRS
ncbi:hypothetical protein KDW_11040 [Dictyobacter vulcani]|uniref:DUF4388 domain-containing protein n=1 Tax=Dictyobacter vulcani TaxID=2607529 RepID=A0A5J4KJ25_9CHLR|nr:hypothetical protein [Dictyobacter vulcani]GER86942.1 hypothetical protein KDW_11040 [Dictyobacter vulcani]